MTHQRALSKTEIKRCEEATQPVCHCRCGGLKHGAKRVPQSAGFGGFAELPMDDPHYIAPISKRETINLLNRVDLYLIRDSELYHNENAWREARHIVYDALTAVRNGYADRGKPAEDQPHSNSSSK